MVGFELVRPLCLMGDGVGLGGRCESVEVGRVAVAESLLLAGQRESVERVATDRP